MVVLWLSVLPPQSMAMGVGTSISMRHDTHTMVFIIDQSIHFFVYRWDMIKRYWLQPAASMWYDQHHQQQQRPSPHDHTTWGEHIYIRAYMPLATLFGVARFQATVTMVMTIARSDQKAFCHSITMLQRSNGQACGCLKVKASPRRATRVHWPLYHGKSLRTAKY